jgi:PBP1b-binding outer membrane lipoprotein LpoB
LHFYTRFAVLFKMILNRTFGAVKTTKKPLNLMTLSTKFIVPVLAAALFVTSCKKNDPEPEPETPIAPPAGYTAPATYDFGANTNFNTSVQRVNMLKELVGYVRSTHNATAQVTVDAAKLKNMFNNSGSPFADQALNGAGISISEKVNNNSNEIAILNAQFDEVAAVSQTTVEGKEGQAGKVLGPVPTNTAAVRAAYLLNAKGFEYKELIEKGIMGSFLYSEAMKILNKIGEFSNTNPIAGSGTAMEHAWDEAFGYYGVPAAFPTVTTGLSYWGSYGNSVNAAIGSNATIMNAFLKGRAAISNNDPAGRDAARDIVVATWEKVCAARLIVYLKQAKTNFANVGPRNHALSESVGFIHSFKYNSAKKISDADIAAVAALLGDNLYTVSSANLDQAISKIATVFSLDASKL